MAPEGLSHNVEVAAIALLSCAPSSRDAPIRTKTRTPHQRNSLVEKPQEPLSSDCIASPLALRSAAQRQRVCFFSSAKARIIQQMQCALKGGNPGCSCKLPQS